MPLVDLSAATRTIVNLLQFSLAPGGANPTVTAIPPDEVESSGANQVSVHLLHITESPEFKNFPPGPRQRKSPIQQLPMGLVLQYVISVARESLTGGGSDSTHIEALDAQTLLGKIARIIHDFPIITPQLQIAGQFVLHTDFAEDNENLELILRPASLEENLNFWATQNQKLARACLFVEARIAILQPQPPQILPGIVLSVGNFVFPSPGPQLFSSKNVLRFQPPNLPDFVTATASPGRVAIFPDDDTMTVAPFDEFEPNNVLTIEASGLSPGKRVLLLRVGGVSFSADMDDPATENFRWDFQVLSNAIQFRPRTQILAFVGSQTTPTIVRLAPGIYGARLRLDDTRLGLTARPRTSNEVAFAVIPQIKEITKNAANDYTLTLAGRYLVDDPAAPVVPGFPQADASPFAPPAPPPPTLFVPGAPDVELSVNGRVLTRVEVVGDLTFDDKYVVLAGGDALRFQLTPPTPPATQPSTSNPFPIQLYVNGASAPPAWLVT
ncbi:MAG TPA: Pvc16 family protein [Polyangiaceae bacterium]